MFKDIIASSSRTILFFTSLGLICYGWMVYSPFKLMDDYACIIQNPQIHSLSNWKLLFADSFFGGDGAYYRPLVSLSFMLEYHFFRYQQVFYNLNNIFLHIACALLVWTILRHLLKDNVWAFWATLLFVIHPVHWEQITNIPGRSILLCAFFVLFAFYSLMKSVDGHAKRPQMVLYYLGSLVMFSAGLLSKESAVTFPFVAAGFLILNVKADVRRKIFLILPYFVLLAGYFWLRAHLGITKLTQIASLEDIVLAVVTFLKSLAIHAGTLILPADLIYDRSLVVFAGFHAWGFWFTAAVFLAAIGSVIYWYRKLLPLHWFWLLWIFFGFLPVSQLIPIYVSEGHISIADHFLYLPSIGIFVFTVEAVRSFFKLPEAVRHLSFKSWNILLGAWLLMLIALTITQALISTNQFVMFERTLEDNPRNHRVRTALGSAYGYAGKPEKAAEHFRQILEYAPMDPKARIGLAKSLCDQNRCLDALMEYHKVFYPSRLDAAILKENLEKTYAIVIRDYLVKVQKDPGNAEFHQVLGTMYVKTGRMEEGRAELARALELAPDLPGALFLMGSVLERTGQPEEAVEHYKKFLSAVPTEEHYGRWMVYKRLAEFYHLRNQQEDAGHFTRMAAEAETHLNADTNLLNYP